MCYRSAAMDITLQRYSLYDLPSQQRVHALVHDGAADLQLWPGPGPDTELRAAWGDDLQRALDTELRQQNGSRPLDIGQPLRIHRGRLHCDFLVWVATRLPEPGVERSPAADEATLRAAVKKVLAFVAERSVERVAFEAMGSGPNELPRAERLVAIARAAQEYEDECRRSGRSTVVEEVLLCEPEIRIFSLARSRIGSLARAVEPPKPKVEAPAKREARSKGESKSAGGGAKRGAPKLTADEIERRRFNSAPYSMKNRYTVAEYLLHARFGVGRVEQVLPEGAVMVLFEDGELRKMVHGRS